MIAELTRLIEVVVRNSVIGGGWKCVHSLTKQVKSKREICERHILPRERDGKSGER